MTRAVKIDALSRKMRSDERQAPSEHAGFGTESSSARSSLSLQRYDFLVAGSVASDRNQVPAALGVPDAPRLLTSASGGFGMSFFELDCARPNIGLTKPVRDDAFLIALQLRRCKDFDLYEDGRLIRPQQFEAGAVAIFDLRTTLASDLRDPFHAIDLYLPFEALNAISDDLSLARVDDLHHTLGTAVIDTTVRDLMLSMRPALAAPAEHTSPLFVDHVAHAIATHVAHTYGRLPVPARRDRGGLAPSQARRVKELLNAHLSGRILLTDLARACDLSVRQFTRAFRQTTGMAPHQWLVRRRIETAKDLLLRDVQPLATVASACGFADQSHFTRVFTRAVGLTPAEWRRTRRA
jgi:AraC family transcriptional regulator